MMQEMTGFWVGSGISWTTCKQSAPRSRQKTTPTPHHSIFTGQMLFPKPNQQCQSTEGRRFSKHKFQIFPILYNGILRAYSDSASVKSHQITYHRGLCVSWPVYRPRRQRTLCQRPVQEQRMLDCHNTWTGDCPCHPTDHTHVTINTTHHPHSIHVSRQLLTSPFRQYTYHPHSIHVNKSTPPQEQQLHTLLDYCELCTLHHQGS